MSADPAEGHAGFEVPRVPASAGALVFDSSGRLLVLKPTYKRKWSIPGGQMETDGETPWETCKRETQEETGLTIDKGRLVCVDFLRPRPGRPGGIRFLFDCGALAEEKLDSIAVPPEEIAEFRFVRLERALKLLSAPLRRRVGASVGAVETLYLEDGVPLTYGAASRPSARSPSRNR